MASSKTEIANMALFHLGVGSTIQDLETENSQEARACRLFYDQARKEILRLSPFPFATKRIELSLITDFEDDDHPTTEWNYQYQYPSNCLFFRRILSGQAIDNSSTKIDYKIEYGTSGAIIFTNQAEAECEYTYDVEEVARFQPDFAQALAFRLAAYIAPTVCGGDPFKMSDRALKFYNLSHSIAASTAFNEEYNLSLIHI